MTSPYAHVSDAMYKLWLECRKVIPGVRLGGIYSDTTGYHNTRRRLLRKKPDSYSIELAMDKKGSADLAAGLDLTMSDAEMRRRTRYLRRSALDPRDDRLRALREFIGTLNSETVFARIDGNAGLGQGRGVDDWSRDSSHLWHIHLSFLRAFAASWKALEPVLSVLAGETWEQWQARKGGISMDIIDIPIPVEGTARNWITERWGYKRISLGGAIASGYGWSRLGVEEGREHHKAVLAGQAAIMARFDGRDDDSTRQIVAEELAKSDDAQIAAFRSLLTGLGTTLAAVVRDAAGDVPEEVLQRVRETVDAAVDDAMSRTRFVTEPATPPASA